MKLIAIILLALVTAVLTSPVSISDNNIGDIINIGVNANLQLSNKIDQNIISVIVALLNKQAIEDDQPPTGNEPIAPLRIPRISEIDTPEVDE